MVLRLPVRNILVLWVIIVHVGGLGTSSRLPKERELSSNKHVAKTIETDYGEVYDCVDFYKQPSFNHPLLKNHSFHPEMRPTSMPDGITRRGLLPNMKELELDSIRLKDGGCPQGTVLIVRTREDDDLANLFHSKSLPNQPARSSSPNAIQQRPGTFFAIAQTKNDPSKAYYGVGATLTVFNPHIIEKPQYSSAEMIIQDGSDSITVGWTVNTNVYVDNRTRLFVYTNMGDKHCFDTGCGGFISVRPDIPPTVALHPISQRGVKLYGARLLVYKDKVNGNWWLQLDDQVIGFWPPQLFKGGLAESGSYVACGGEVYFPEHGKPGAVGPEMGSGVFPDAVVEDNASCSYLQVVNDQNQLVEVETEVFANDPDSYKVWEQVDGVYGHMVFFGGPLRP